MHVAPIIPVNPAIEERLRKREALARALYDAVHDPGDPPFDQLDPTEQSEWMREARRAERRADPAVAAVAMEMGAQAWAQECGWDWPWLHGFAILPGSGNLELARIEQRQRMRYMGRAICHAYDRHLAEGNFRDVLGLEDRELAIIREQKEADVKRRRELKPGLTVIDGGKDRV